MSATSAGPGPLRVIACLVAACVLGVGVIFATRDPGRVALVATIAARAKNPAWLSRGAETVRVEPCQGCRRVVLPYAVTCFPLGAEATADSSDGIVIIRDGSGGVSFFGPLSSATRIPDFSVFTTKALGLPAHWEADVSKANQQQLQEGIPWWKRAADTVPLPADRLHAMTEPEFRAYVVMLAAKAELLCAVASPVLFLQGPHVQGLVLPRGDSDWIVIAEPRIAWSQTIVVYGEASERRTDAAKAIVGSYQITRANWLELEPFKRRRELADSVSIDAAVDAVQSQGREVSN